MPDAGPDDSDDHLSRLRKTKDERLKDLLGRKPSQKHYKRALRAFLEADGQFQTALIRRLGLDTPN